MIRPLDLFEGIGVHTNAYHTPICSVAFTDYIADLLEFLDYAARPTVGDPQARRDLPNSSLAVLVDMDRGAHRVSGYGRWNSAVAVGESDCRVFGRDAIRRRGSAA